MRDRADWDPRFHEASLLFWPIRSYAERFSAFSAWPTVDDCDRALGEGFPVRFREQPPRAGRRGRRRRAPVDAAALYDARIHVEGWVPTRPRSWHDFLNLLVWAAFPRAKAALHARQHRAVAARLGAGARTLPGARTREQDGLALLDEGGLLLLCEARCAAAVRSAPDLGLADVVRDAVRRGEALVLIFGHALYERLVLGGPPIHAMMQPLSCPGPLPTAAAERVVLADAGLCEALLAPESFTCPERFHRLPLDERVLCAA
jgi:Protein of unknown function (DUF3025)